VVYETGGTRDYINAGGLGALDSTGVCQMPNICCPTSLPGYHPPSGGTAIGPEARQLYRSIEVFSAQIGLEPPILLSQCRSAALQLAMQRAWDTGRRTGLRVRPADPQNSRHVPDENGICYAFDLGNSNPWLDRVGRWVVDTQPGAVWGGTWLRRDSPHFEVSEHARWVSVVNIRI